MTLTLGNRRLTTRSLLVPKIFVSNLPNKAELSIDQCKCFAIAEHERGLPSRSRKSRLLFELQATAMPGSGIKSIGLEFVGDAPASERGRNCLGSWTCSV